tara:strand:- start:56 stop:718 length:663 start_codon:yes stop_codon:yes gene_type:complete
MIGIIIPYRNREEHLKMFMKKVYPLFKKYLNSFIIVISEQDDSSKFNRGKLINAAFKELNKRYPITYIMTHDVDLIPKDENCVKTVYTNSSDLTRIHNAHGSSLGGVVKMKKEIFELCNGFPNHIWGWGIEDRALFLRVLYKDIKIENKFYRYCTEQPHMKNGRLYEGELKQISDIYTQTNDLDNRKKIYESGLSNINYVLNHSEQVNENTILFKFNLLK